MTVTLLQLKNSEVVLSKLLSTELPVQISYRLSKLIKKVNEELTDFESSRQKLFEKYGEPADNNSITVKPECQQDFLADLNNLLAETVELPDIKININDIADVKFSAFEITQIEPWIDAE
jgi:hypothetical protein